MTPSAAIIVLCHNKAHLTVRCVESLARNTDPDSARIVVFDNASSDDTPRLVPAAMGGMSNAAYVRSDRNLGFGAGNNRAAEGAAEEFLVFLNNDTEVRPGWLEPLIERLRGDPSIGAAGAKLIYPNGKLQEAGGIIFRDGSGWNVGRYDDPDDPRYNLAREVDYCSGAALMVRARLFRDLGGFDPLFDPAYFEDTDLCFRLRSAGHSVWYEPRSAVVHHEGGTAGTDTSKGFKRFQEVNRIKFARRWSAELVRQPDAAADPSDAWWLADRRRRSRPERTDGRGLAAGALPNGGISFGSGVHEDEAGWRWLGPIASLFVWAEAVREPSTLTFTLHIGAPEHYPSLPLRSRVSCGDAEHIDEEFTCDIPSRDLHLPLVPGAGDVHVRIASSTWFVPSRVGASSDSRELAVRIGRVRVSCGLP